MAFAGEQRSNSVTGMRVLIIVENLPVPFDRRVWLEALTLLDAGCIVSVICPRTVRYPQIFEELDGIRIYRHPLPCEGSHSAIGFFLEYLVALAFEMLLSVWVFFRHGIDTIHACNPPDTIFLIGLLFKPFGIRFVFDQHDINPELYVAKYGRKDFYYRLLIFLERMTFRTADIVLSTNQSYRAIAIERGSKSPEDVFIVRSAPDTRRFHAVNPDPALKKGRRYLVAYLGVMGKQEGVDLLLESVYHILFTEGRSDISFVLIGSGPEHANLTQLCKSRGLDGYVTFTGRIPDSELLTYLSTADVCVNPDRVNEMNDKSTMNKIMEYMAVGKPIVQFELTEGRFSASAASLYANPNDPIDFANKITLLLDDPDQRAIMGAFGLSRLKTQLDWTFSQEALLKAYKRLAWESIPLAATEETA